MSSRVFRTISACCGVFVASLGAAQSPPVRISQIFGLAGANSTSPNADYVELYNASDQSVLLDGWSVQVNHNGTAPWQIVSLSGIILPHRYYLVQLGSAASQGVPLPTPDAGPAAAYSDSLGTAGKVALLTSSQPLFGRPECPFPTTLVDFVGYGRDLGAQDQRMPCTVASATIHNAPESLAIPVVFAVHRGCEGERNTGINASDFVTLPPLPRNSLYSPPQDRPPSMAILALPSAPYAGGSLAINAFPMVCSGQVVSVTGNFAELGGPSSLVLTEDGSGRFSASIALPSTLPPGTHSYSVTLLDSRGNSVIVNRSLSTTAGHVGNDSCGDALLPQYQLSVGVPVTGNGQLADLFSPTSCVSNVGHTLWYRFVPTQSRSYRISTCGSPDNADTTLGLFTTVDCNDFTPIGCNDDSTFCGQQSPVRRFSALDRFLTAGTAYYICVGCNGPFQLQVVTINLAGDLCTQSAGLGTFAAGESTLAVSNEFAQLALDGPEFTCATPTSKDMWFIFGAPSGPTRTWRIDSCGSSFDTVLALYRWMGTCETVQPVSCNDDALTGPCAGTTQSSLSLSLIPSATYRIRVAAKGADPAGGGFLRLNVHLLSPPDNSTCSQAMNWSASSVNAATNEFDSLTLDPNCPAIECGPACKDVFWIYAPSTTAMYDISTCGGPALDTVLQVLDGCGPQAQSVACNDDSTSCGPGGKSKVTVQLTAAHTYFIRVAAKGSDGPGGPIYLDIVRTSPSNDHCEAAIPLAEGVPALGDTAGSDITSPLPASLCFQTTNATPQQFPDVFYTFTPSSTGLFRIDTCGSVSDTLLSLHTECPASASNMLACNGLANPACTLAAASISSVELLSGHSYVVRVVAQNGPGPYVVQVNRILPTGACCRGSICSLSEPQNCTGPGVNFAGSGVACNPPTNFTTPCCKADFDQTGGVTIQDIFAFLHGWFAQDPRTEVSGNGILGVPDIFEFLGAWFAGC